MPLRFGVAFFMNIYRTLNTTNAHNLSAHRSIFFNQNR